MKNIISLLLSLTAILFLFSCGQSKNSNEKNANSAEKPPLTAKIDGKLFQAFELPSYGLKVITPTHFQVNIFGIAQNGERITLKIENYKGAGTYSIGSGKLNEANQSVSTAVYIQSDEENPENKKTWFSETGEITIFSEVNELLTGSFSFTAKTEQGETKNISEGVFDIAVKR